MSSILKSNYKHRCRVKTIKTNVKILQKHFFHQFIHKRFLVREIHIFFAKRNAIIFVATKSTMKSIYYGIGLCKTMKGVNVEKQLHIMSTISIVETHSDFHCLSKNEYC